MFFDYNFGLYLTVWDRIGGTHRNPSANYGKGPLDQVRQQEAAEALNGKHDTNGNGKHYETSETVEIKAKAA